MLKLYYNDLGKKSDSSHTHSFASITNKPTNLTGYRIADATKSLLAEKFEYGHAITYSYFSPNPFYVAAKKDTYSSINAPYKKGWTRVICNAYTNSQYVIITDIDMSNPSEINVCLTNTSSSNIQIVYFIGILYIKDTIIKE